MDAIILQSHRRITRQNAKTAETTHCQWNGSNGGKKETNCRAWNVQMNDMNRIMNVISIVCSGFGQLNTVWLSCEGENPADIENVGPIEYYPRQGFPGYYFPYENSEGYLSPLVAIHFTKPTRKWTSSYRRHLFSTPSIWKWDFTHFAWFSGGIIINVECKAWAYNIKHDRKERTGSVHFELMIDWVSGDGVFTRVFTCIQARKSFQSTLKSNNKIYSTFL